MNDILYKSRRMLGSIITLLALSSLGFFTDNPKTMVPIYFVFFLLVFAGMYAYTAYRFKNTKQIVTVRSEKQKKKLMQAAETNSLHRLIQGIFLTAVSIFVPSFIFRDVGFTVGIHIFLIFLTLVLLAAATFSVYLINKKTLLHGIIGYAALVIICSMPAIVMMQYDRSYNALGTAYYSALVITVLAWYGEVMIFRNIKLPDFIK